MADDYDQLIDTYPSDGKPRQKERISCVPPERSARSFDVLDGLEEEDEGARSKCTCEITAEYSAHAYFLVPLFQQSDQG